MRPQSLVLVSVSCLFLDACAFSESQLVYNSHTETALTICDIANGGLEFDGLEVNVRGYYFTDYMHGSVLVDLECPRESILVANDPTPFGSSVFAESHELVRALRQIWADLDKIVRAEFVGVLSAREGGGAPYAITLTDAQSVELESGKVIDVIRYAHWPSAE